MLHLVWSEMHHVQNWAFNFPIISILLTYVEFTYVDFLTRSSPLLSKLRRNINSTHYRSSFRFPLTETICLPSLLSDSRKLAPYTISRKPSSYLLLSNTATTYLFHQRAPACMHACSTPNPAT